MNTERLEEKAQEFSAFANSTTRHSNSIVLFTMLVLQEILETQAQQPQTNLASIIALANAIASLSTSLRIS